MNPQIKLFLLFLTISFHGSAGAPISRTVFRCTATDESVRYQDQPCELLELSRALSVSAVDPLLPKVAISPVVRVTKQTQRRRKSPRFVQVNSAVAAPKFRRKNRKAHLVTQLPQGACPATYEDAGVYVQGRSRWQAPGGSSGKSKAPFSAIYAHYRSLPGKTYLKNQGLWPAHCPP